MGCVTSAPPKRAPKQPLPDMETLKRTPAPVVKGEPSLSHNADMMANGGDRNQSMSLVMKQTGAARNGNTYEICTPTSTTRDDLLAEPAFGIGGQQLRRQMQDLLVLHRNKRLDAKQTPICYIVKDVARGTNYFQILKTTPIRDGQEPSSILGPNRQSLYIYALIDFDLHTHVCSIRLDGQGKNAPPLYTCRQCTPTDWVILKAGKPISLISQVKGLMPKFTAWDLTLSPRVSPALIVSLAVCIDWFVQVMKKETIRSFE